MKKLLNSLIQNQFDYDEMVATFKEYRERLLPMICDATDKINKALDAKQVVLFEGAQA